MNPIFNPHTIRNLLFLLWAAACQLTGGYYVITALHRDKISVHSVIGALLVLASTMILGLVPLPYSRAYVAYAGVLVLLASLWGLRYTGARPDGIDLVGSIMVLGGVSIIVLTPRR